MHPTLNRIIGLTGIAVVATLGPLRGQDAPLSDVLERVGAYATTFQRQLSNIVAEERYVQDIARINLLPGRFAPESHRELLSDVLLVRPASTDRYVEFRDVFEVDGRRVRDRQERLTSLFLDPTPSAEAQIQRINRESARYNIGNIERTINTPTLALLFVLPQNQPRFRFSRTVRSAPVIARIGGAAVSSAAWVVEYEEAQRPTLIRTTQGLDLPAHGRFWVDAETGRVLMSELITDDPTVRATIDVRYQWDPLAELMVPAEMRERYEGRRDGAVIEGSASYGKIRQFQVRSNERLAGSKRNDINQPVAVAPEGPAAPVPDPPATEVSVEQPAASAGVPVAIAQPPAPAAPRPQTFQAASELVLVDLVVTDRTGHPVRGLSARDFIVKEDGKAHPIVKFEAFAGNGALMPTSSGTAPDSAGNGPSLSSSSSTVVLVDDGQLTPAQGARLRPAIKALLAAVGTPSGALNLVAPGSRVSVAGTLPAGAADLARAADAVVGQRIEEHSNFPIADAEAIDIARGELTPLARVAARFATLNPELTPQQATEFARELANKAAHDARARRNAMYDAVLVCLDWLGSRPGRHSLIVVSAGFSQDPDDSKYYDVVTRSLRVNAPIHFLDARGLQGISSYAGPETSTLLGRNADEGPFGFWLAAQGSMALADDTGGIVVSNSNDMAKGLGQLLETMTSYYLLAYQPPKHDKPGYRKIRVEVLTKGLQVRARRGYFSGAPASR